MYTRYLSVLMGLLLSGCITVDSEKQHELDSQSLANQSRFVDSVKLKNRMFARSVIFRDSSAPFEEFFEALSNEGFGSAIANTNFWFKDGNSSNEAIQLMLNAGLVPAFIRIKNNSKKERIIDSKTIVLNLQETNSKVAPLSEGQLPSKLESLNFKAIGANVYNSVIGIAAFAGMMVSAMATRSSTGLRPAGLGRNPCPANQNGRSCAPKSGLMNPLYYTDKIKMENAIFPAKAKIKPGEFAEGLLVFDAGYDPKGRASLIFTK